MATEKTKTKKSSTEPETKVSKSSSTVKKATKVKPEVAEAVLVQPEVKVKAEKVKAETKEVAAEVISKPSKAKAKKVEAKASPRLKTKYKTDIVPQLFKDLALTSVMEVPALDKIVVNIGVGDATSNAKLLEDAVRELTEITGQKPVITKSKKAIASFKLREDQAIGTKVTLRGRAMYTFLDKLIAVSLPRVRDFRGLSRNAFDGRGNYTLGIKEQLIFPEINFDRVNKVRGMDIVIVTTAKTDAHAYALLKAFGMPFKQ